MSLATLLLLADGRLPSGGHAHSGGLEAQVSAGRVGDLDGLAGFLRGKLATSGLVAAAFAAAACHRTLGTSPPAHLARATPPAHPPRATPQPAHPARGDQTPPLYFVPDISDLDQGLDARTPSPALRKASRAQGRALLRAGRAMWAIPEIGREPHQPVALGVLARAAGLGPLEAAVAAAHGTVTGSASAGVRLLGLDPYAVHGLLARLAPDCDRVAASAAARAGDPVDELPAAGAPLLDIGAELHATWEVRLFAS
ncbi:urease accessory protein UreF [Paractinoplanes atraurantiacus]|uniref:Urease accessory protein UreF n=1 Tax=Paractinoplanes atraurantiacus TaxID=1036182 RepID=A0A285J733_9ACTN|nr:urease accessory UreF family protein [Actinoplanes atraurantiacus]SNY56022.1 urease accessory protein [Actinoplanes atraurantiacus]